MDRQPRARSRYFEIKTLQARIFKYYLLKKMVKLIQIATSFTVVMLLSNCTNGFKLNAQSQEQLKSSVNGIIRSEYTPLDSESCGEIIKYDDETGDTKQACPGYDNIPVLVKNIDGRQTVDLGGNTIESLGWDFNRLGEKLEWRLRDDEPFAAIYRYYIDDVGGDSGSSALAIVKISASAGECIAGMVDGNLPEANELARRFADEKIADFECGVDSPEEISG